MKVLHILDHSRPVMSGYSTRSWNIVTFQRSLGLDPVVVGLQPKHPLAEEQREILDGIAHYRTPAATGARTLPYLAELQLMSRMAGQIARIAQAEGAKILHAPLARSQRIARILGRASSRHSDGLRGAGVLGGRGGRPRDHAGGVGALSGQSRTRNVPVQAVPWGRRDCRSDAPRDRRPWGGPRRVTVVPNGVDIDRFVPAPRDEALARRLRIGSGPVFGFIGSFYRYEGLRFLLESVPALRQRVPHAQVLLVGSGEEAPHLRELGAALGNAVVFAGEVPNQEVRDYYSLVDIFVCPVCACA